MQLVLTLHNEYLFYTTTQRILLYPTSTSTCNDFIYIPRVLTLCNEYLLDISSIYSVQHVLSLYTTNTSLCNEYLLYATSISTYNEYLHIKRVFTLYNEYLQYATSTSTCIDTATYNEYLLYITSISTYREYLLDRTSTNSMQRQYIEYIQQLRMYIQRVPFHTTITHSIQRVLTLYNEHLLFPPSTYTCIEYLLYTSTCTPTYNKYLYIQQVITQYYEYLLYAKSTFLHRILFHTKSTSTKIACLLYAMSTYSMQ